MIIVNFKTYLEASGENSVKLANIIKEVSEETGVEIIACPQTVDLRNVVDILPDSTWAQHVDAKERGRATGWFPPEVAKEVGATGVLLNHSEHQLTTGDLMESLNKSKEIGLKTTILTASPEEAKAASFLKPDFVGYEPPELIGSKDTSVARAKPEVIKNVVEELQGTKVLVGAGIKDKNDIEVSLELGSIGFVLASSVILADDQRAVLLELTEGYQK